jgi:YD repeat-containing protein
VPGEDSIVKERRRIQGAALVSAGLLAVGALAGPRKAGAVSSTVTISQVYAAGGESGATFQNDYVVLFNNGITSIDISSWSLQVEVAGPVGPMWEVIPLCDEIPHGHYYLVALGSGGPAGIPLPASDCSGTVDLPSTTGKIALVSGTSSLSGTCPPPTAGVVDFLGYGSSVDCSEGSPAGSPAPTTALFRSAAAPCTDTDDNSNDFALGTPVPKNTASPGDGCNNAAPTVASIPAASVNEQEALTVTPSESDPNGDPIAWSGLNLPLGSSVDAGTGVFTWTPGGGDAASYAGVTLIAADGLGGSDSASFDITVVDVTIPVLDPIADQVVAEGSSVVVTASATDADGDPLTFSYSPPLPWITPTPMTGDFTIAPGYDVAGLGGASFGVTMEASDGTNSAMTSFTVDVVDVTTVANTPHAGRTWTGVSAATGELSIAETADLCLGGPVPLCFSRYYASLLDREGEAQSSLGTNWLGSYDWRLVETPSEVKVVDPRGRVYRFASGAGGAWTLVEPQDGPYELTDLGTEFSLTHARHRLFYILDRTMSKLTRVEDGRGNVHTLSYVGGDLATVSDGLGRTLTFGHDGSGKVTSVTDGTRTVTYAYTGSTLATVTDAESKTTTYLYDVAHAIPGLLTGVLDASAGNRLQYAYDPEGRVSQVQLETGDAMTLQLTMPSPGQVEAQVQWPDGGIHHYVHDSYGRLTQYIDPQSGTTSWGYDTQGRPTSVARPSTIVPVTIGYDPVSGLPSTLTLPDANTWQISYVARSFAQGQLYFPEIVRAPDLGEVTYMYDGAGNLTQITDQASQSWTMTYNGFGQPLSITNPTSGVITLTYDASGRLLTANDGAGTTQFAHDGLDRLMTITHPDASVRTFTWNGRNQLLTATNELSKTWTYTYRDNGQLETITDPLLAMTILGYDSRDRLAQITDALSGVTGIAYDASWQVSSITDATMRAVGFQYDLLGRITGISDPGGEATTFGYDADSRLTSVTDPLTHTWSYGYDARDRLTSRTDPLMNTTTYGYDPVGRITAINQPLGLATTYAYDLRGLRTSATRGPVTVGYAYTSLGQLETFTDGEGHPWSRSHDPTGRLTGVTDPLLRSATLSYDNRNRVTGVTHPEGSTTYTYDVASRMTQRSYSDGTTHNYTYDDVGRMLTTEGVTRTYDALGRITEENGIGYTYDAAGRLETETYSTGHEVGHNFGNRGLPSQTIDWLSGVTTYTFDAAGRLTDLGRPNRTSTHYEYDAANALLSIVEVGATDSIGSIQLARDALSRVTSAERSVPIPSWTPETASRSYAYDAASQVTGFSYDNTGRLVGDGVRTYAWDGASRADSIQEGPVAIRYEADGLDRVAHAISPAASSLDLLYAAPGFSIAPEAGGVAFGDGIRGARPPSGIGEVDPYSLAGGPEGADGEGFSPRVSERLRHKDRAVTSLGLVSPARESYALSIVREGGSNDRTHYIHGPGGRPLHSIDLKGATPMARYYHFDEAGNVTFMTNEDGAVITSYSYSPSGESSALGETQPYPGFTWEGMFGTTEEYPTGLYRLAGGATSFYDAVTTQNVPTHGSCGCKSTFTRSRIHAPLLPSPGRFDDLTLPPEGQQDDHPQEILEIVAAATGDLHHSHPQEVLDLVAAATGSSGSSSQANRRYLYFPKTAATEYNRGKLLVGVDDVSLQDVQHPSTTGANRRYLYFSKAAATAGRRLDYITVSAPRTNPPGALLPLTRVLSEIAAWGSANPPRGGWLLDSAPTPRIPLVYHGERATVEWIP